MNNKNIRFSRHALQQMFARKISKEDIKRVLDDFEIINDYPDDKPYPSKLIIGFVKDRPIHIVIAEAEKDIVIVTVYEPEKDLWENNFKRRKI